MDDEQKRKLAVAVMQVPRKYVAAVEAVLDRLGYTLPSDQNDGRSRASGSTRALSG